MSTVSTATFSTLKKKLIVISRCSPLFTSTCWLLYLFTNPCLTQLQSKASELDYFGYPNSSDIVRFSAPHIVKCNFETVQKHLSVHKLHEALQKYESKVIVKVVSKAIYDDNLSTLIQFLNYVVAQAQFHKRLKEKDKQLQEQLLQNDKQFQERLAEKDKQLQELRKQLPTSADY